jgi:hypothetical protein
MNEISNKDYIMRKKLGDTNYSGDMFIFCAKVFILDFP